MSKKEILHIYTIVSTEIQEEEGTSLETKLEVLNVLTNMECHISCGMR